MAREALDRKVKLLKDELLVQGSMVEQMTLQAVRALVERDLEAARRIYTYDRRVNLKHMEIEKQCLSLMATEPPILATDLRMLASILEVNSALERLGDYAKGIARICLLMKLEVPMKNPLPLSNLADMVMDMLHQALGSFVTRDLQLAESIPCRNQTQVKQSAENINQQLLSLMLADPSTIQRANKLLWVNHNFERMAELIVSICERTVYIDTGDLEPLKPTADLSNGLAV